MQLDSKWVWENKWVTRMEVWPFQWRRDADKHSHIAGTSKSRVNRIFKNCIWGCRVSRNLRSSCSFYDEIWDISRLGYFRWYKRVCFGIRGSRTSRGARLSWGIPIASLELKTSRLWAVPPVQRSLCFLGIGHERLHSFQFWIHFHGIIPPSSELRSDRDY